MITRRTALGLLGAGAAAGGTAWWWLGANRREVIEALDADADAEPSLRVLRRPFPPEPGREISALGYGGTRLPILNRDESQIDYELGEKLIDFAYRHGVNYFDTGWFYHKGQSERFLGKALKKYPRESFMISDKVAPWCVKTLDDAKRIFEEQLRRLDTDYFDIYMIHSLSSRGDYKKMTSDLGVVDFMREQKARGRIRHLGFSFHGRSDLLDEVLSSDGEWEAVIALVNALEHRTNPDSRKNLEVLRRHNVPGIAMEPLGGGRLMNMSPEGKARLEEADPGSTVAKWSYRYAQSNGAVICSLSGMGHMKWLAENVRTHAEGEFKPLSPEEMKVFDEVVDDFASHKTVPCTGCLYCMPCPYGVAIPKVFAWYNSFAVKGRLPYPAGKDRSPELRREFLMSYARQVPRGCGPDHCTGCRKCTVACPQFIFKIPDEMKRIAGQLKDIRACTSSQKNDII